MSAERILAPLLLAGAAAGLYIRTLYPSIGYGDSGELIAAAYRLGVNHPPSNPTYLLLAWGFGHLVPVGDFAWRVNLLSALLGAAAVGLLFLAGARVLALRPTVAALLAAALAVSPVFWGQCVVAEVYLLESLVVGVLLAAVAWGDRSRWRPWAFLAAGAGMGVHYSMVFVLPTLLWWSLADAGADRLRRTIAAGALFLAGASVMGYVWLRAGAAPEVDYGHIRTLPDLFGHLFWQQYSGRPAIPRDAALAIRQLGWTAWIALREVNALLVLAIPGAVALARRKRYDFLLFGPLFLAGMVALFNHPSFAMAAVEAPPKLLPLVLWCYLLAVVGAGSLRWRSLALGAAGLAVAVNAAAAFPARIGGGNLVYRTWGEALLREASGSGTATIFVEGDVNLMPLLYLKAVEAKGPDVTVVDRGGGYFGDFYGGVNTASKRDLPLRRKIENDFLERAPGRVFSTSRFDGLGSRPVAQHGLLFEIQAGGRQPATAPVPALPEEFVRAIGEPGRLEYRERDIVSRFLARQALAAAGAAESEVLLRRAADVSPDNPRHLAALASFLAANERGDEARGLFRRAYEIEWFFEPAIAGHVQSLVDAGDLPGAIAVTERFLRLEPGNPYTLHNLARLKEAAGDRAAAERLDREAARLQGF